MYLHPTHTAPDLAEEDDETDDTVLDTSLARYPQYRRRSDLFHVLRADHEELLRYFRRMSAGDPADYAARWLELSFPLEAHIQTEREIVYPVLLRCDATREEARRWLDDHSDFETLAIEIDRLPGGDPTLLPMVRQLVRKLQKHVEDEEHLVTCLEGALPEDELESVASAFERRRRQIERERRARRTLARTGAIAPLSRERRGLGGRGPSAPEENRAPATPEYAPVRSADPQARVQTPVKRAFLQARILVAGPTESDVVALAEILSEASYSRVEITTDPGSVAHLHRKNAYDLIVLDLGAIRPAPHTDPATSHRAPSGLEVLDQLGQLDPDGHVPVVAMATGTNEQVRALRAGARDFVSRPFEAPEVLSRIATVLEARIPEVARRQRYRSIERDLSVAAEIYRALLPASLPAAPGYEVAVVSRSADDTSGDIYDVVSRSTGHLVLLLADATGHGIGPALSATQLRSMVRIALRLGASLDGIVAEADRQLATDLPPDRFVTAFMGELDPTTHVLEYFAPGQGPLLHWHTAAGAPEWRNASGAPLGISLQTFQRPPPMHLAEGDVVVLATDGLYERADRNGVLFHRAGVEQVLREVAEHSAVEIGEALRVAADAHAGGRPPDDDTTMIVLKRMPAAVRRGCED